MAKKTQAPTENKRLKHNHKIMLIIGIILTYFGLSGVEISFMQGLFTVLGSAIAGAALFGIAVTNNKNSK